MGGIPISKEHGLNPALAKCPRCGQDNGELVSLGRSNQYECGSCKAKYVGYAGSSRLHGCGCPKCGNKKYRTVIKQGITDKDGPIVGNLCKECETELTTFENEVKAGGVRWKCAACNSSGITKAGTPYAVHLRTEVKDVDWDKTGIELTAEQCPRCRGEVV